jgi:glutamate N-acetyltransferase/amino-acid N-acetyltransferase
VEAGIRYPGSPRPGRDQLFDEGTQVAAVFTRNAFLRGTGAGGAGTSSAVQQQPRLLLINTGNANAGTGAAGLAARA